jgi:hypothetical protein
MIRHNSRSQLFLILVSILGLFNACKKDNKQEGLPEYRIAFWCVIDDGCGYIDVSVDGVAKGQVKYWQKNGPTNCAESIISLSIPITKGKHIFRFANNCWSAKVDYEIKDECTLYKVEK